MEYSLLAFFSIYVDSVLHSLSRSGLGCYIKGSCVNSLMYADDLLLISISLNHLQRLVELCVSEFELLGMKINADKTACIRIGLRHSNKSVSIKVNDKFVDWKNEIKYLGLFINAGRRFVCNLQNQRQKFFRSINGIFGRVGMKSSPLVLMSLINSFCLPILLYSMEAVYLNKRDVTKLDSAYSQSFSKIFNTWDTNVVNQCQYFMSSLYVISCNMYYYMLTK